MGFFDKLKQGLAKTKQVFSFTKVDENLLEELEEKLIIADVGMETTENIIENLRQKIKKDNLKEAEEVRQALRDEIANILDSEKSDLDIDTTPAVILMVGVNGAGKTTSIGKIANKLVKEGKKVIVAAGDTFRAAAVEQLEVWANRAGVQIVKGPEGVDPASVIFDAIKVAKNENADVLICDTSRKL